MSNNPYVAQLRKLLPFLGRNVCYGDRNLHLKRFRKLYSEAPEQFLDAYDAVIEEIRRDYPHEMSEMIETAALAEIDDQVVASTRPDGTVAAVYAAGFFAYGLENQQLLTEALEPEDARRLRELLLREYFDEEAATIRIYENLIPLNHTIISNADDSQRFLEVMMSSKSDFVRADSSVDFPGLSADYAEEDESDVAARFRLVLFTVRQKDPERPVLRRPWRFNGFAIPKGRDAVISTDAVLATPWGAEFTALVSRRCGRGLRYAVTEPYLLNDTVRQLDYVVGLKRVMVTFTRTALDAGVSPEDLIVSFGAFTDPQRGYSELRVAFALPGNPDELINGVPIPLPNVLTERAVEELAALVRATFEFEGVRLRVPIGADCPMLTAEPDTMDRLYNSIRNVQSPLRRPDLTPKPGIPSMLLN